MIEKALQKFCSFPGCVTFPPASAADIKNVNQNMRKNGFCEIPAEYQLFLSATDGLSYNGIEFFGTCSHYREKKAYTFPDLTASTKHYQEYHFFRNKIIIGRISESLIFYDNANALYAVADRLTLRSRREYASFDELLKIFLDICAAEQPI